MIHILLWDLGITRGEINEPLGIDLIKSTLIKRFLCRVEIKREFHENDIDSLELNKYDIIGISAQIGTFNFLNKILDKIHTFSSQPLVVLGNSIPTFAYKEILSKWDKVICVLGEGESPMNLIVDEFVKNKEQFNSKLYSIPSVAFSSNNNIHLSDKETEDLSKLCLPNRYFSKSISKQGGIIRIEGSRGCSWSRCSFCAVNGKYGDKKWRPFPINYIINDLINLSNLGCRSPYFSDEDFFGNDYQRSLILAKAIISKKQEGKINPEMDFFISARINDIIHDDSIELLKIWKQAGLREVFLGIESGCKMQLKRYGKLATIDKNLQALEILRRLSFQIDIGYIFFDPEMTFEELLENINYVKTLKISNFDSRSIKAMRVQPNTKLYEKYKQLGLVDVNKSLDVNNLTYDVKYIDSRVKQVLDKYISWENMFSQEIYNLQSKSRGEVESEKLRLNYKNNLGLLRDIDFMILQKLTESQMELIPQIDLSEFINRMISEKENIITKTKSITLN